MPVLCISTNVLVQPAAISPLLELLSSAVARTLEQPQHHVMVLLRGEQALCFGGTREPAAFGELLCVSGLGPEMNAKLSAAMSRVLEAHLRIPPSRFCVAFRNSKEGDRTSYDADCFHALHQ